MPTYNYRCECGNEMEIILRMKDHINHWPCSRCGKDAQQHIKQAPTVTIPAHMRFDWNGYDSPVTGQHIRNKREHIEDLARHDCIEYDPGMKQDADRRVIEQDKALDRLVDETVERELEQMPTIKREALDAELSRGVSIEMERQTL